MTTSQDERIPLTWNQVAAFRLSRHHLVKRAPTKDLVSVAGDMTGAQAQLHSAARLSLWSRVRDLQISDVEEALNERAMVKAACMRRTLFLVPSEHLAIFVRGTARRAEKGIRWAGGKGVPENVLEAVIDNVLNELDQPLTRLEIAERVSRATGVRMRSIQGGGWGSRREVAAVPVGEITFPAVELLHLAAARGVVCYGPNRGNEPTFVRADAWIPQWQDITRDQAEDTLLRFYLRAFGPATAVDFAMWTGMTLGEARQIWARQQASLAPVDVDGWIAEVLREDLVDLAKSEFDQPLVRLLPYFDTFLLGHMQKEHLVAVEHRSKVYRPQGWIAPVVLVDGRVAAVWEQASVGNRLRVKVAMFGTLSQRITAGIKEEAQELGRFLGIPIVEVEIV